MTIIARLIGEELLAQFHVAGLVIRCGYTDREVQGFAVGDRKFTDVVNRALLLNLAQVDLAELAGQVGRADLDIGFNAFEVTTFFQYRNV